MLLVRDLLFLKHMTPIHLFWIHYFICVLLGIKKRFMPYLIRWVCTKVYLSKNKYNQSQFQFESLPIKIPDKIIISYTSIQYCCYLQGKINNILLEYDFEYFSFA